MPPMNWAQADAVLIGLILVKLLWDEVKSTRGWRGWIRDRVGLGTPPCCQGCEQMMPRLEAIETAIRENLEGREDVADRAQVLSMRRDSEISKLRDEIAHVEARMNEMADSIDALMRQAGLVPVKATP